MSFFFQQIRKVFRILKKIFSNRGFLFFLIFCLFVFSSLYLIKRFSFSLDIFQETLKLFLGLNFSLVIFFSVTYSKKPQLIKMNEKALNIAMKIVVDEAIIDLVNQGRIYLKDEENMRIQLTDHVKLFVKNELKNLSVKLKTPMFIVGFVMLLSLFLYIFSVHTYSSNLIGIVWFVFFALLALDIVAFLMSLNHSIYLNTDGKSIISDITKSWVLSRISGRKVK